MRFFWSACLFGLLVASLGSFSHKWSSSTDQGHLHVDVSQQVAGQSQVRPPFVPVTLVSAELPTSKMIEPLNSGSRNQGGVALELAQTISPELQLR